MGDCSSTSHCNPCGPDFNAINQLAVMSAAYARNAQTYSVNAANAANEAENILEDFQSLYLGAFAEAPVGPHETGALYWNLGNNTMYVWDGTAWIANGNFNEFTNFSLPYTTTLGVANFVTGQEYEIVTVGNTNWTGIGAASATVGVRFTKNAVAATGTGTARLTRDLNTRFADVVNVKDFGAVGDGVADDTAAIQAAVTTGKWCFIPRGKYRITSEIVFTKGSGLIGESFYIQQFYTNTPASGQLSEIFYDGLLSSNTCILRLSTQAVGVLPTFASNESNNLTNTIVKNIYLNGNSKADFGLYSARNGFGSIFENIIVSNTNNRGFFFGEFWSSSVSKCVASFNNGSGFSIGENLFGWSTGNIVNAIEFDNLIAYKNGRSATYNDATAPTSGVGFFIGVNRSCVFTNIVAELNYGAGLYVSPRSGPTLINGVYVEDNCHYDPVTDSASNTGTAYSSGAASKPWGMVGFNRKDATGDTILIRINTFLGASPGARMQAVKLTGSKSGGYVISPTEGWLFQSLWGISDFDSDFSEYELQYAQKALTDTNPLNFDLTSYLPTYGIPESILSSQTTIYAGHAKTGKGDGRSISDLCTLEQAISIARVCENIDTINISSMTSTSLGYGKALNGVGITRKITIDGGSVARINNDSVSNFSLYLENWNFLELKNLLVLERVSIRDSYVILNNIALIITGANNLVVPAVNAINSKLEINGTSVINTSTSTSATKMGIGIYNNSHVSFNNSSAGTIASYTNGYAINFFEGSGIARISTTTATATWAGNANVNRATDGGAGVVIATNGLNP